MSSQWREPSNIIGIVAVIFSITAFAVSIKSCNTSDRAFELSKADFSAARLAVFVGAVNESNDSITIKPIDDSMILQRAKATFPSEIEKDDSDILPPKYDLPLLSLRYQLQKALEKRIPRKKGYALLSADASVPVVIDSAYTAKGETRIDRSVYMISYEFVVQDAKTSPEIRFHGLHFLFRLHADEDTREILKQIWTKNGILLPRD